MHRAAARHEQQREAHERGLTAPAAFTTIGAMDRTLLTQILDATPGFSKTPEGYLAADEHRASIYLGKTGQATLLTDIVRIALHDTHLEAEAKDRTLHFVVYEPVLGLSLRRPREDVPRTGF